MNRSPDPLADYLMTHGVLKNADARRMAAHIRARFLQPLSPAPVLKPSPSLAHQDQSRRKRECNPRRGLTINRTPDHP